MATHDPHVRAVGTKDLRPAEIEAVRTLLWAAFPAGDEEGFDETDWDHALGGTHFLLEADGRIVAHAAVVERDVHVGDRHLRTGYVEAVATDPAQRGKGYGSRVMHEVGAHIREHFELGALGTGRHAFYERLGWLTWQGPSGVRTAGGPVRTPDEDGFIMVLSTTRTPPLDPSAPISCEWRPGDVW